MNTIYYATSMPTILDVKKMHFVLMITIYYTHVLGREKVQPSTITCSEITWFNDPHDKCSSTGLRNFYSKLHFAWKLCNLLAVKTHVVNFLMLLYTASTFNKIKYQPFWRFLCRHLGRHRRCTKGHGWFLAGGGRRGQRDGGEGGLHGCLDGGWWGWGLGAGHGDRILWPETRKQIVCSVREKLCSLSLQCKRYSMSKTKTGFPSTHSIVIQGF